MEQRKTRKQSFRVCFVMARLTGIEPATFRIGICHSILLSYRRLWYVLLYHIYALNVHFFSCNPL